MHGTEAIIPLATGGVPIESPVMSELLQTLKNSPTDNTMMAELVQSLKNAPAGTTINLSPLIEKMAENNQLLRAQVEATKRTNDALEYNNDLNKQILSVTR